VVVVVIVVIVVVVKPSRVVSPLPVDLIRGPRGGGEPPPWGDVLWDL